MATSESLSNLSDRAKQAEHKAADAARQTKPDLEKSVNDCRVSAQVQADKLRGSAKASEGKVSPWWGEQQQTWNGHSAKVRQNVDEKKAERDVKKAPQRSDDAEADADFAVDYAFAAIEDAEYAVLDAILARQDADDVAVGGAGNAQGWGQ